MVDIRSAMLRGTAEARRLHNTLGINEKSPLPGGRVDVYQIAETLEIPVVFRPLKGLLGAYLPKPAPGILISTQRSPRVQRFTCAHEIGHFSLGHEQSLDGESHIGVAFSSRHGTQVEMEADAFAFSFLMPQWLVKQHLRKLREEGLKLPSHIGVYQLSLRLGCSYTATIHALSQYKLLDINSKNHLLHVAPKAIKQAILNGVHIDDWHKDVWLLTEADRGELLQIGQGDVLVSKFSEPSTAGYLTQLDDLEKQGFRVIADTAVSRHDHHESNPAIGGFPIVKIVSQATEAGVKTYSIKAQRPWEPPENAIQTYTKEVSIRPPDLGLSLEARSVELRRVA